MHAGWNQDLPKLSTGEAASPSPLMEKKKKKRTIGESKLAILFSFSFFFFVCWKKVQVDSAFLFLGVNYEDFFLVPVSYCRSFRTTESTRTRTLFCLWERRKPVRQLQSGKKIALQEHDKSEGDKIEISLGSKFGLFRKDFLAEL
jgi:hypothetical protein